MTDAATTVDRDAQAPLLDVQEIHAFYGNIHALHGISLNVRQGEIVTLVGGNGAGKSTTLNAICGIVPPREGAIHLAGDDLVGRPAHEIVARGVTQVPEGRRTFARLTVSENLQMGAYVVRDKATVQQRSEEVFQLFPRLRERRDQAAAEQVEALRPTPEGQRDQVRARRDQVAGTLSGGEQQMLAMGRALMSGPKLLLLDEPSMGLAPVLVEQIFETIKRLNDTGTTILLVEQNARMALQIAHRGYVIESGRIVLEDEATRLRDNEMVRKSYLGIA